jgi:hypothetical protein
MRDRDSEESLHAGQPFGQILDSRVQRNVASGSALECARRRWAAK